MEDEDGEGSNIDSWTISEQLSCKNTLYIRDETINSKSNNVNDHVDCVETDKKEISSDDKIFNSKIIYKGFKKRILAQTQENQLPESISNNDEFVASSPKTSKDKSNDNKCGKITEYAQYLGLQPTSKYKCPKCNPLITYRSMSMYKQHQCVCTSNSNPHHGIPSTSEQHGIDTSFKNNFRISRKVYLCAACGTYFENWNLFLHMREIHKRHICLFCLGMFGQAERLSHHLMKKHNVPETQFYTIDDFYSVFKGSCYLICCTCEKVFSETDNFYTHICDFPNQRTSTTSVCSICRQKDGIHLSTCKLYINSVRSNTNERIQASDSEQTLFPNPANAVAKKLLGANRGRLETKERLLLSSYNRKLLDICAKKINLKSQRRSMKIPENEWDLYGQSPIDMKVKTITAAMHISKYNNERQHDRLLASNNTMMKRHIVEIDVTKSPAHERIIDRYTDTIMQVSQYGDDSKNNEEFEVNQREEVMDKIDEMATGGSDDDENESYYDRINNYDDTPEDIEQGELILDDGNDDTPVESPSVSPNRISLATIQEIPMRTEEKSTVPTLVDKPTTTVCLTPKESSNIIVSKVNSTNRSLVIKICTNKNSQFAITTSNSNGNYKNNCQDDSEDRENVREEREKAVDDEEEEEEEDDDNDNDDDDDDEEEAEEEEEEEEGDAGDEEEVEVEEEEKEEKKAKEVKNVEDNHDGDDDGDSEENNNASEAIVEKEISESDRVNDSDSGKVNMMTLPEEPSVKSNTLLLPTETMSTSVVTMPNELPVMEKSMEEDEKIDNTPQIKETIIESQLVQQLEPIQIKKDENLLNININETVETMVENDSVEISKDDDKLKQIEADEWENKPVDESCQTVTLASDEIQSIDLNVSGTLDSIEIEDLLKQCITAASPTCIYCNHARHIAVNGKQLALHMLAEHRFQPQHPAIIIHSEQFNVRVKKSLDELTMRWFNLDSYDNTRGTYNISTVKTYECYLCRIYYAVHKELYLHNRKMHQKTILICIMCKSTFYSHSELLCHLCPGVYTSHISIRYRCCLCPIESLPSAFRLMVHLRKRHHACDVCLESTGNQQRLSNHVWKHKLHHLCYRCGIAYRNKPDITKHLFWKHGTESVLCKKCLQKKWPHIYHFCIPPSTFVCDECGSTFSRAIALKVHKRLHSGDEPHVCSECSTSFISKKLLIKHEQQHKPPPIEVTSSVVPQPDDVRMEICAPSELNKNTIQKSDETAIEFISDVNNSNPKIQKESVRKVLDVYDLPPLNLSSDSDSDIEDEKTVKKEKEIIDKLQINEEIKINSDVENNKDNKDNSSMESTIHEHIDINIENITERTLQTETNDSIRDADESNEDEIKKEEVVIMNGIWDNFKSYTASLESKEINNKTDNDFLKSTGVLEVIAAEHDYCIVYENDSKSDQIIMSNIQVESDDIKTIENHPTTSITANGEGDTLKRKTNKSVKKKIKQSQDDSGGGDDGGGGGDSSTSSDSSSDSDSSSCSCGTNCSCSSSSSGSSTSSSSSSDSESTTPESSPKKSTIAKKDRKKDKDIRKNRIKDSSQITPTNIQIDVQVENSVVQTTNDDGAVEVTDDNETSQHITDRVIHPPEPEPLRESDLETDETETDEDFYDKYPQQHANKLLTEKRNQSMIHSTVAPQSTDDTMLSTSSSSVTVNNGTIKTSNDITHSLSQSQSNVGQINTTIRHKIKTKRRKKSEMGRSKGRQLHPMQTAVSTATIVNPTPPVVESIKLNIPKFLYQNKKPGGRRRSSSPNVNAIKSREPRLPAVTYHISQSDRNTNQQTPSRTINTHFSSIENENTNENKRSSKRKRVPKKFYGDSSDEEQRHTNSITQKWRKIDSHTSIVPYVPSITIKPNYGPVSTTIQSAKIYQSVSEPDTEPILPSKSTSTPSIEQPPPTSPVTDSEDVQDDSSSDSSTSEIEESQHPQRQPPEQNNSQATAPPNRQTNLYCYCQCPYDEVSEMIACDGNNCRIEWFHFECVGIMVPPKGKWYCPDCSKRDPTLPNNQYYD